MSEPKLPSSLPVWIAEHIKLYQTDPDKAHMWDSGMAGGTDKITTLLLTTIGRKSGEPRPLPLIYQKVGDDYVVIGSKGGAPDHPVWYKNLVAEPNCQVQVAKDKFSAVARTAEGDERKRLWTVITEVFPAYDEYQKLAGERQIPVVVLERK